MATRGTGKTVFGLGLVWDRFIDDIRTDYRIQDRQSRKYEIFGPLFANNDYQLELSRVTLEELKKGGPARMCGPKPRKAGFSTWTAALANQLAQRLGWECGIMAHEEEATRYVFNIARNIWEKQQLAKPDLDEDGVKSMTFKAAGVDLGAGRIYCATAGGRHPLTTRTISFLALDESSKYPGDHEVQNKLVTSVMGTVPTEGPSLVYKFSTANGSAGDFYETVMEAYEAEQKGRQSDWRLLFWPWYKDRGNSLPVEKNYDWKQWPLDDIERERMLVKVYGLTNEQLRFRRFQIKQLRGSVDLFDQEYPSTVRGAFRSNDRAVIPRDVLDKLRLGLEPPAGRWRVAESHDDG